MQINEDMKTGIGIIRTVFKYKAFQYLLGFKLSAIVHAIRLYFFESLMGFWVTLVLVLE